MAKYRKKPVIVDAVQFTELSRSRLGGMPDGVIWQGSKFYINTLEGGMEVSVGDWIITGVMGEKYPCKPDVFALTYEPVELADHKDLADSREKQRWLKPSEVTEPGVYWIADSEYPTLALRIGNINADQSGKLLGHRVEYLRYFGPIQPPEYKGE